MKKAMKVVTKILDDQDYEIQGSTVKMNTSNRS